MVGHVPWHHVVVASNDAGSILMGVLPVAMTNRYSNATLHNSAGLKVGSAIAIPTSSMLKGFPLQQGGVDILNPLLHYNHCKRRRRRAGVIVGAKKIAGFIRKIFLRLNNNKNWSHWNIVLPIAWIFHIANSLAIISSTTALVNLAIAFALLFARCGWKE
jgi:hypothetical protein